MNLLYVLFFCFFFSSRRRHTRWPRDWSSDVCSSDLRRSRACGGDEGGFRHGFAGAGQRSLSPDRSTHARLRRRASAPNFPRPHRYACRCYRQRQGSRGQLSPPRTPADPSSVGSHGKTYRSALVEWITLTPDNLRWTSKHAAHLGQRLAVEIQVSSFACAVQRKAREVVEKSGANSEQYFNRVVLGEVSFRDQAKTYLRWATTRDREPIKDSSSDLYVLN